MQRGGFTILEILITITIMSLFIGGAFVGFSNFSKRQKVIAAGETLKNTLRDIQSRVTTGETDCSVCDCSTGGNISDGWWVDFSAMEYYGECQNTEYFRQPFALSAGTVITAQITPPYQMRFRPPPAGIDNAGTVCVSHPDLSDSYYKVRVESSGNITDTGQLDANCTP